jgi:predicted protein tyrosine phosphatase
MFVNKQPVELMTSNPEKNIQTERIDELFRRLELRIPPEDAQPVDGSAHEILPRLFLGDQKFADSKENLARYNIAGVISLRDPSFLLKSHKGITYHRVWIADDDDEPLLPIHRQDCFEFIDSILHIKQAVLVHCMMGISRSSTMVIAYLMSELGMPFQVALSFVQNKRRIVDPNSGFRSQLERWELELQDKWKKEQNEILLVLTRYPEFRKHVLDYFGHWHSSSLI